MPRALVYPGSRYKPLGPQTQRLMLAHDIVCNHTMVGYLISTDRYFRISNGVGFRGTESHYGVGGKWGPDLGGGLDGAVWQWQDRRYSADANLDGWDRVISIETADNAARPIQPWTPKMCQSLAEIWAWESSPAAHALCPSSWKCHQVGIPLELIPDTRQGRRGIGWHAQGAPQNRVSGGEAWTNSYGKDCPTAARIRQQAGILVVAREIRYDKPSPAPTDWFDMATRAELREEIDAALARNKVSVFQDAAADGVDQAMNGTNVPKKVRAAAAAGVWGAGFGRDENRKTAATVLAIVMQQNAQLLAILTELAADGKLTDSQAQRLSDVADAGNLDGVEVSAPAEDGSDG